MTGIDDVPRGAPQCRRRLRLTHEHEVLLGAFPEAIALLSALCVLVASLALGLRIQNMRNAARWREQEERWQPLVLGCLAGDAAASEIHAAVGPGERGRFLLYLARLARRVDGPERQMLERLAEPFLEGLARRAGRAIRPEARATALRTLGALGYAAHRDLLRAAVSARAPVVAATATRIVAARGDSDDVRELLRRISEAKPNAADAFPPRSLFFGPRSEPALREVLASRSAVPLSRILAASALLARGGAEAVEVAARVLREESPPFELATHLLGMLAASRDRRHLPAIRPWCACAHPETACAALRALGRLGAREDVPLLAEAAGQPSPWIGLEAARALLALGEEPLLAEWAGGSDARAAIARELLGAPR